MSRKQKTAKDYDFFVNKKNTPHLKEKTVAIGAGNLFTGVNLIIYAVRFAADNMLLFVGILLLLVTPLMVTDPKRGNRGTGAVIATGIFHLLFCIGLSYVHSAYWMAVWGVEVITCSGVIVAVRAHKAHRHTQR